MIFFLIKMSSNLYPESSEYFVSAAVHDYFWREGKNIRIIFG